MAAPAKPSAGAAPNAAVAGGVSGRVWMAGGAAFLILALFAPAAALLLMAGLCPTFVGALADQRPGHARTYVMGILNLAGAWPFMLDLWSKGATMDAAQVIMRNPFTWLGMYGAVGIALFLLWLGPVVAAGCITLARRRLTAELASSRKALEKEWGRGVTQPERPGSP